jgi:hypothetical protein
VTECGGGAIAMKDEVTSKSNSLTQDCCCYVEEEEEETVTRDWCEPKTTGALATKSFGFPQRKAAEFLLQMGLRYACSRKLLWMGERVAPLRDTQVARV